MLVHEKKGLHDCPCSVGYNTPQRGTVNKMRQVIAARDLKPGLAVTFPDMGPMVVSSLSLEESCARVRFQGDGRQYRFPLNWGVWVEPDLPPQNLYLT